MFQILMKKLQMEKSQVNVPKLKHKLKQTTEQLQNILKQLTKIIFSMLTFSFDAFNYSLKNSGKVDRNTHANTVSSSSKLVKVDLCTRIVLGFPTRTYPILWDLENKKTMLGLISSQPFTTTFLFSHWETSLVDWSGHRIMLVPYIVWFMQCYVLQPLSKSISAKFK